MFIALLMFRIDLSGDSCYPISSILSLYFCVPSAVGINPDEVTVSSLSNFSATLLLGIVLAQSLLGYIIAYLSGTIVRVRSDTPQSSEKDLQQPWETAVRQSEPYDPLEVVTVNGDKIHGRLYRIGSPSEDADVLLFGARQETESGDPEFLGMSYHHYQDIARVQFPELEPDPPGPEDNYILRTRNYILKFHRHTKQSYWEGVYSRYLSQEEIHTITQRGAYLYYYIQEKEK
ncbi:hypothetical protein [Natrononativus amylolyticus]|uniref:hypothetical protein n=1 Tax=Natrononativus amylolyticus TaxID=2963434 RepID=UPI0020CCF0F9|nr:hypothetical protein [Natrononativus amylolyticus]